MKISLQLFYNIFLTIRAVFTFQFFNFQGSWCHRRLITFYHCTYSFCDNSNLSFL